MSQHHRQEGSRLHWFPPPATSAGAVVTVDLSDLLFNGNRIGGVVDFSSKLYYDKWLGSLTRTWHHHPHSRRLISVPSNRSKCVKPDLSSWEHDDRERLSIDLRFSVVASRWTTSGQFPDRERAQPCSASYVALTWDSALGGLSPVSC